MGSKANSPEASGDKTGGRGVREFTAEELRQYAEQVSALSEEIRTCGYRMETELATKIVSVDANKSLDNAIMFINTFLNKWPGAFRKALQDPKNKKGAATSKAADEPSAPEPPRKAKRARKT